LPSDIISFELLAHFSVNTLFNIEDVYQHQSSTTAEEKFMSMTERSFFVSVKKARSKVLAVWKAFVTVKAVAKLSPSSNFMPWTRLFFARCVKLKGSEEYLKQVTVQKPNLTLTYLT
jgi:hypothetical protein